MLSTRTVAVAIFTLLTGSVESIHVGNASSTTTAATNTPAPAGSLNSPFTATTGTGSAYASACAAAYYSYTSEQSYYKAHNATTGTVTSYAGGTSYQLLTYFANATTLCDGHPRLTTSPAVPLSTGWSTATHSATETVLQPYTIYNIPRNVTSPYCSINPDDCDPLWTSYSSALSQWATPTGGGNPQITASPQTPPCMNATAASSFSSVSASLYGCGLCTIFGNDVQLLYFPEPTTVSRDFCASTPTAQLTHYGFDAVITAFAGTAAMNQSSVARVKRDVAGDYAVVNGHTLASGTAYISIRSVWAEDRCSSQIGSTVTDAILAMPSESVLSLRYSQNSFQYFASTNVQTGYPVSYADFNNPVPWSAWNGQAICGGPNWGFGCDVIYENQYRPQLAIPPGIRMLDPKWANCQMWYGGLYDPPMALSRTTLDAASPIGYASTQTAAPSVAAMPTTATKTADALADNLPSTPGANTLPAQTATAAQSDGSSGNGNGNGQQEQGSAADGDNGVQGSNAQGSGSGSSAQAQSGAVQTGSGSGLSGQAQSEAAQSGVSGGSTSSGVSDGADSDSSVGQAGSSGGSVSGNADGADSGSGVAQAGGSGASNSGSGVAPAGGSGAFNSGSGVAQAGSSGSPVSGDSGASNSGASDAGSNSVSSNGDSDGGASNNMGAESQHRVFAVNGQTFTADATSDVVLVGSQTLTKGASAQTLPGSVVASYGADGLVIKSSSAIGMSRLAGGSNAVGTGTGSGATTVVTIVNQIVTVSQCNPSGALAVGSTTLLSGGAPVTLQDGLVVSDVDGSLDWTWASTVAINAETASSRGSSGYASSTDNGDEARTSSTSIRASAATSGVSRSSNSNGVASTQTSTQSSDALRTFSRLDVLFTTLACFISTLVI